MLERHHELVCMIRRKIQALGLARLVLRGCPGHLDRVVRAGYPCPRLLGNEWADGKAGDAAKVARRMPSFVWGFQDRVPWPLPRGAGRASAAAVPFEAPDGAECHHACRALERERACDTVACAQVGVLVLPLKQLRGIIQGIFHQFPVVGAVPEERGAEVVPLLRQDRDAHL